MLEKTLESPLDCKVWCWNSNSLATWWEEPSHWKRPCCLERLRAGGEEAAGDEDGYIASPTQWMWVWANSRDSGGQRSLVCCSPWGLKELDTTEQLNSNSSPWPRKGTTLKSDRQSCLPLWGRAFQKGDSPHRCSYPKGIGYKICP